MLFSGDFVANTSPDPSERTDKLPFKVTASTIRIKMPEYEVRWLLDHLRQSSCKVLIPDLRNLYETDGLLKIFVDPKLPNTNIQNIVKSSGKRQPKLLQIRINTMNYVPREPLQLQRERISSFILSFDVS